MRSKNIHEECNLRTAVGIMMLTLLLAGGAGAATFTVDDSGGADYARIQDAIDNASVGDTILVYSGTYYENVNVSKQLILRGIDDGGGKPVVDASENGNAITLSAGNSTLEGFTTVNAGYSPSAGILANSNSNIIRNNNVSNNSNGIFLNGSSNSTLSNNNASNNADSIVLVYSNNNTLSCNNVNANSNNYHGIDRPLPAITSFTITYESKLVQFGTMDISHTCCFLEKQICYIISVTKSNLFRFPCNRYYKLLISIYK